MFGASLYYFPPRDFPGPQHPPFPIRNACSLRVSPVVFFQELNVSPLYQHPQSRSKFSSELIPPSNYPATETLEPQEENWQYFYLLFKVFLTSFSIFGLNYLLITLYLKLKLNRIIILRIVFCK
jgi:hypothetical protein